MSPETWLSIGMGAGALFVSALGLAFGRSRDSRTDERAFLERLVRVESKLELIAPWVSAQMLHSPHNPYGIDPLLEKFADEAFESADEIRELAQRLIWIVDGDRRAFVGQNGEEIPEKHRKLASVVLEEIVRRYALENLG